MSQLRCRLAFALAVALTATSACAWAQSPAKRMKREHRREERQTIEQLEHELQQAQLNGDPTVLEKVLSDDYLGISANGELSTKTQQIDHMRNRQLVITHFDVEDTKIKITGGTAIVTSEVQLEGTIDGSALHGRYRYMRVYQRTAPGEWRVTSFEATPERGPAETAAPTAQAAPSSTPRATP